MLIMNREAKPRHNFSSSGFPWPKQEVRHIDMQMEAMTKCMKSLDSSPREDYELIVATNCTEENRGTFSAR